MGDKAVAIFEKLVSRQQENLGNSRDEAVKSVRIDIGAFADGYIDVFNRNYVETGERFDNPLFYGDSSVCQELFG